MEDIARSVRSAFASERLQSSWKLLCSPERSDREAALGGIERLLARNGLTMDHVLQAIMALPLDHSQHVGEQISMELQPPRKQPEFEVHTARPTAVCDTPQKVLAGRSIPQNIGGRVSLKSEKTTCRGNEITVSVTAGSVCYEPLKAKDERVINVLRQAAENRVLTQLIVEPVKDGRRVPLIIQAGVGIGF